MLDSVAESRTKHAKHEMLAPTPFFVVSDHKNANCTIVAYP